MSTYPGRVPFSEEGLNSGPLEVPYTNFLSALFCSIAALNPSLFALVGIFQINIYLSPKFFAGSASHFLPTSWMILTILFTKTIISSCRLSVVSANYLMRTTLKIISILCPGIMRSMKSSFLVKDWATT